MADDINHVVLVGRLTRDAELKYTNSGTPLSKFSIAVNRRRKSGDQWEEEANYFDIVLWGKVAEALSSYLVKGKQVGIQGELRQNRWEQDGQKRSRVEIVAFNIQLLGGRGQQSAGPGGPRDFEGADTGGPMGPSGSAGGPASNSPSEDDFEDDIPF